MLGYDTLARVYGWTFAQIDEQPEQAIEDAIEIWNARGRVAATQARRKAASDLASQVTAKWGRR